ncbi:MAG: response regulator transcription factor [Armatimonadetes bacterium]|nr:response regulator transcription factor [Armatimonadota bacterium]
MARILIVEDEAPLMQAVSYNLEQEGYQVVQANDGLSGLDAARREKPDLILLDIMLPSVDGIEVCRLLRKETDVPIIMLTARSREIDKVVGLEVGADDYVTKPFGMLELLARVRAALRRARTEVKKDEVLRAGELEMDVARHQVTVSGKEAVLRPKEFYLLHTLLANRGRVLERSDLLERIWGEDEYIDAGTLDVHVRRLREKIEPDPGRPKYIVTVRGIGYKFAEQNS